MSQLRDRVPDSSTHPSLVTSLWRWETDRCEVSPKYSDALCEILGCSPEDLGLVTESQCWSEIVERRFEPSTKLPERDLRTVEFVAWLADHSRHPFPALYSRVCDLMARMSAEPQSTRHGRDYAKRLVTRDLIARRIRSYYGAEGFYGADVNGVSVPLSVFTRPDWLDVAVPLATSSERSHYTPTPVSNYELDDLAVAVAIERLAHAELNGTVMVNNPLYRLLDIDLRHGRLESTVTTVPFAEHALTTELMEGEMLTAISTGADELPLRDLYLPSTDAAFALRDRACVGGPTTLLAIARRQPHGAKDYVLLAQERSNSVLNLAGKLAVVPKGFHQPTSSAADEVALSSTLRREFEEELLGREDLEQVTEVRHSQIDPLHPQALTPPVVWLLERPDAWRTECTGLGFNLLTANFEFACLVVIEDDTWWDQFGHLVVKNWEAERMFRYSTRDAASVEALIHDPRWGNESLFAFLQGLRRLSESGAPERLALPLVELAL